MEAINIQNERSAELRYGNQNGKLVHISEVESGLDCECICPACKTPLVARKGDIRTHHFAHHQGTDSAACVETALHLFAKQVIAEHKKIRIPEDLLVAKGVDLYGKIHQRQMLITSALIEFEKVGLEVHKGTYRSDATGYPYENQDLDIEIRVSHEVDKEKQEKVRDADTCMLEIDLSELDRDASPEEITQAVIIDAPRTWINNPVHQAEKARLQREVDQEVLEANKGYKKELEKAAVLSLSSKSPDNHMLLGFKVASGYSHRYQKNFELCKLYTVRQVVSSNTRNFTCTNSAGFEMEEFDMDECCIKQLESLNYPVEASLTMGSKLSGRRFAPIVLDIQVR